MMNSKAMESFIRQKQANQLVYQSKEPEYHPFRGETVIKDSASMIEVFIPANYFVNSPFKWSDFNSSHVLTESMMHIIELFYYVSQELGGSSTPSHGLFIPDQVATFEVVPGAANKQEIEEDDGGGQSRTGIRTAGYRLRIMTQGIPKKKADDRDNNSNDGDHFNGDGDNNNNNDNNNENDDEDGDSHFRNKKKEKTKKKPDIETKDTNIAVIIQKLVRKNQFFEDCNRKKRTKPRTENDSKALEFLYSLTLKKYVSLCSVYTGAVIPYDQAAATPLFDQTNPANPYHVFGISQSMRNAHIAGANHQCCMEINYYSLQRDPDERTGATPVFDFPYPANVWRMNPTYLKPGDAGRVYWPMVESPASPNDHQRLAYIKNNADDDSDEARARAAHIYDEHIATTATTLEESSDIDTLKKKHMDVIASINDMPDIDARTKQKMILEANEKSLNDFAILFSPDGDGPDALRATARFMNDYLSQYKTFCLNVQKISKNLTQFGDEMVSMLICMETLWNVNTQHKDSLALLFKNLHVYALTPFNPHTANFGPGMAGKSFGFLLVMKWLIPNTFVNTTYSSAKANVVPGHKNRCMIRFFEDVFPAFLGVHGGAKGSETANTDMEAIVKAWLTSGRMQAHVLDTTFGRANAVGVELQSKCESVINLCSNTTAQSVPNAMRTRYHTNAWQVKDRLEGGGLLGKANKVTNPQQKQAESLFIMRMRRNQALICVILQLIYIGILPAVDMRVARMIFWKTLQKAKQIGLSGTEDIRSFERLEMVCRVLVIWDAITILWDSPDSPIRFDKNGKEMPHQLCHFLLVGRYLRSNVDHAVMTLGLLNNQYDDSIVDTIIDDLAKTRFKNCSVGVKLRAPGAGNAPGKKGNKNKNRARHDDEQSEFVASEPGIPREDADYFIAPFDLAAMDKRLKVDSNKERAELLARMQYSEMRIKPLEADVVSGYQRLLEKHVEAQPTESEKEKMKLTGSYEPRQIPALDFRGNFVYLSKHIVAEHGTNALKKCTESVINHEYAKAGEYVYGVTREDCPFLYETIKVNRQSTYARKVLSVIEPNFFESTLVSVTERYVQGMASVVNKYRKKQKTDNNSDSSSSSSSSSNDNSSDGVDKDDVYSMKNAFATLPRFQIDIDWNEYADVSFLLRENFTDNQLAALAIGDPLDRAIDLIERHEQSNGRKLIVYPDELPHATPKKYHNDQALAVQNNPEKYSLRHHLERQQTIKAAALDNRIIAEEELVPVNDDAPVDDEDRLDADDSDRGDDDEFIEEQDGEREDEDQEYEDEIQPLRDANNQSNQFNDDDNNDEDSFTGDNNNDANTSRLRALQLHSANNNNNANTSNSEYDPVSHIENEDEMINASNATDSNIDDMLQEEGGR